MPVIDVVSDASVALKWFHAAGEQEVGAAGSLLERQSVGEVVLQVLDLTFYEIGNALMRGRARRSAEQTASVLGALRQICLTISPDDADLALANELAAEYQLTLYAAAYAAVARRRNGALVTLGRQLLDARLGTHPADL